MTRDKQTAPRLLEKARKRHGPPGGIIIDGLRQGKAAIGQGIVNVARRCDDEAAGKVWCKR